MSGGDVRRRPGAGPAGPGVGREWPGAGPERLAPGPEGLVGVPRRRGLARRLGLIAVVAAGACALLWAAAAVHAVVGGGAVPSSLELVSSSVGGGGAGGDGAGGDGESRRPRVSADGRWVVFESAATDLVPGDTNGQVDVFLRDRQTGVTVRVSRGVGGETDDRSWYPDISADGRFVVYESWASNIVPGDTNGRSDVFVWDRIGGTTQRVSISTAGAESVDDSNRPVISADGRWIAFISQASSLVAGDTNQLQDVFLHDRVERTTQRVSVSSAGAEADGLSFDAAISADGRFVAFESMAGNLVAGDDNGVMDVFVHDRVTSTVRRVSVSTAGAEGNDSSEDPALAADGSFVVFWSTADNLTARDSTGFSDVFLHDMASGVTTLLSRPEGRFATNASSDSAEISGDRRFVAFRSYSTELVVGDTNQSSDIYLLDLVTGRIDLASALPDGTRSDGDSWAPALTGSGRSVAFYSAAADLVPVPGASAENVFYAVMPPAAEPAFVDSASLPASLAIESLARAGIVAGYDVGGGRWEFRPANPVKRAQFAKMIVGSLGYAVSEGVPFAPFTDLGADDLGDLYPHEYVGVAYERGITKGLTASSFGPYVNISRAQLITMVVRAIAAEDPWWLKTPPPGWRGMLPTGDPTHGENIARAEHSGLLDGIPLAGWDVWADATRSETAQILFNSRKK